MKIDNATWRNNFNSNHYCTHSYSVYDSYRECLRFTHEPHI